MQLPRPGAPQTENTPAEKPFVCTSNLPLLPEIAQG
jgi:hypothetical protein